MIISEIPGFRRLTQAVPSGSRSSVWRGLKKAFCLLPVWLISQGVASAQVTNGSFETGGLSGWIVRDLNDPYRAIAAEIDGVTDGAFSSFASQATDGSHSLLTGFDGDGPGVISLAQYIGVVGPNASLTFDWRAGWDMAPYGATLDRTFGLQIQSKDGAITLGSYLFLTAAAGTAVNDTGLNSEFIDLGSYLGETSGFNLTGPFPKTSPVRPCLNLITSSPRESPARRRSLCC